MSELLSKALRAPQVIENRGEEVAVVLSIGEYERLRAASAAPRPTALAELVSFTERLKSEGELAFDLPKRQVDRERPSPFGDGD